MKSKVKIIWKLIAVSLIAGLILSVTGIALGASRSLYWDRSGVHISGGLISTITERDLQPFNTIYVSAGFSDVEFVSSDKFGIDLYARDMEWFWSLENETLIVNHDRGTRLQILNFEFAPHERNRATIYIPENAELNIVNIETSSGNINLSSFNAKTTSINNSFGNIGLNNITSDTLQVELSSGNFTGSDLTSDNLIYSNRFGDGIFTSVQANRIKADCSSGDLRFTDCEFGNIVMTNSFGSINATGLISQRANIRVSSGGIFITGNMSGETVLHAGFGDIKLTTSGEKSDYSFDISAKFGNIRFDGERQRDQTSIISGATLENHIKITSSNGDVSVDFGG